MDYVLNLHKLIRVRLDQCLKGRDQKKDRVFKETGRISAGSTFSLRVNTEPVAEHSGKGTRGMCKTECMIIWGN